MGKSFMEPEVEVVEFEMSEIEGIATSGDVENPVEPGEGWWDDQE